MKNQGWVWAFVGIVLVIVFVAFNAGEIFRRPASNPAAEDDFALMPEVEYEYADAPEAPGMEEAGTVSQEIAGSETASTQSPTVEASEPAESVVKAAPEKDAAYAIQVSSFRNETHARATLEELRQAGQDAYIVTKDLGPKGVWHRIYVGRYKDKSEAREALSRMNSKYQGSFVVRLQTGR